MGTATHNVTNWRLRMSMRRQMQRWALFAGLAVTMACGASEPAPPAETPAPAEPAASTPAAPPPAGPRVFFVEPMDGATVKSPLHVVFGIENYVVSPVPQGATAGRPGMGHHHLGIDTDCLPPGTPVPQANPWRHFGAGQTEVDVPLQPGPHKLTLQLGD